ncbi:MAG: TatD family hydrolase [Candidatus Uhrbacteria bacterium]|nr:TatD family hydrolase [Candidatus Uhrbacteria bacterium]
MKFRLIDTHTHAHFQAYSKDMDEVVNRALDEGTAMITVGTQSTTSRKGIELAERYDGVWATIGLHPSHLHKQEFFDDNELPPEKRVTGKIKTRAEWFDADEYRKLAEHPKVVAIGEFGLDYFRLPPNVDREQMIADQKTSVEAQLRFATEVNKPVIIHSRDAHEDQFEILKKALDRGDIPELGVIHCFTGSAEDAARYKAIGFLVSIGGIVTFSKGLQATVKDIPLEQIMLETDAPYLSPEPKRGKRNEPSYVKYVAEKIAEIKGVSFEEVAETTTNNAMNLFKLKV